jgi:hypothetical protein
MKINKSKQTPLVYNKDYKCVYMTVNRAIIRYLIGLCMSFLDIIPSIPFSLDLYPFSPDSIMMIGCHPYFGNCISFIFKQDYLGSITGFFIISFYHSIQNVSLTIGNLIEESIPHSDDILTVS